MSEVVIPGGFGSATLQWAVDGKVNPISCTLGYAFNNGSGGPTAQDCADFIFDAFTDTSAALCDAAQMNEIFTFLGVQVAQNEGGTMTGAYSSQPAIPGSLTGFNSPVINSTLVVQKRTPRIGRAFRGRMYWPPLAMDETNVDPLGVLGGAFVTAQSTKFAHALAEMADALVPAYLLHSNADDEPTIVTTFQVASVVGTQRRRIR